MTISLVPQDSRQRRFEMTGGETVLPVTFAFFEATDLLLLRQRDGITTTLTLSADYTVSGAGNPAGGTVTLADPALAGDLVVVISAQSDARTSDWTDGQALTAAALNAEFARKWIGVQQLRRDVDRAVRLPAIDPPGGLELPDQATRAGRFLGFDGSGGAVAMGAPDAPLGAVARSGDTMTGDLTISKTAPALALNSATPTARAVRWRTAGVARWGLLAWNDAESGGNVGSTFYLQRHDDAGAFTGNVFRAERDTGRFVFMGSVLPRVPALDPTDANDVARKAYVDGGDRWVRIADVAVTAVAQIDVLWTEGQYRAVELILTGLAPATPGAGTNLLMRMRRAGSFLAGASDYSSECLIQESAAVTGVSFTSGAWFLTRGGMSTPADHITGRYLIDPGAASREPGIVGHERHSASTPIRRQMQIGGSIPAEGATDGIRLLWEGAGNFAAIGRIIVNGLAT